MEDAEGEVIDLLDSPDGQQPSRGAGTKRRRSDAIDLAAEEEAAGAAAAAEEAAAAKARIMAHAARVNRERGLAPLLAAQHHQQQPPDAGGRGADRAAALPVTGATVAPPAAAASGVPQANRLLAQLHAERMARQAERQQHQHQLPPPPSQPSQQAPARASAAQLGVQPPRQLQQQGQLQRLSLLTWNVWFREDLCGEQRMAAIGSTIQARQPDFVCLQEVTPRIYSMFSQSAWWHAYAASPMPHGAPYFTMLLWRRATVQQAGCYAELPFDNSVMGRDLKTVTGKVGGWPVRVATAHLESPTGRDQMFSQQRVAQCKQSLAVLDRARERDVLFAGDMNWGPDDGVPPLPGGWSDAWLHLHSTDPGLTYDPRANPMLKPGNRIRRRLDRVFARLHHWRLLSLEMVGREALPGLLFEGRPVLPSDHFGLLLVLRPATA